MQSDQQHKGFEQHKNLALSDEVFRKMAEPKLIEYSAIEMIERVKSVIHHLGLSSLMINNIDQFDKSNTDVEELHEGFVEGSSMHGMECPYNIIIFRKQNKWLFDCANMFYRICGNHIICSNAPSSAFCRFIEFEKDDKVIFMIPRSNGTNCEAIMDYRGGIKLHKSRRFDSGLDIYIYCTFNADGSPIEPDQTSGDSLKLVKLSDVITLNPCLKNIELHFSLFSEEEINNSNKVKAEIMLYFNSLHLDWFNTTFVPIINNMTYNAVKGQGVEKCEIMMGAIKIKVYENEKSYYI